MMGGGGMMRSGMMGGGMMGDQRKFEVLEIRPNSQQGRSARLPVQLVDLESPEPTSAIRTRQFVLNMGMGGMMARGGAFRSEERRVGNEWVSTGRSRGSPLH